MINDYFYLSKIISDLKLKKYFWNSYEYIKLNYKNITNNQNIINFKIKIINIFF